MFWRSFNNMKFAWKGTFEALMVKFEGKIGTLYQIFTPCTHCKFCMMFKRKGGRGQRPFEMFKKTALFSRDGFPYCPSYIQALGKTCINKLYWLKNSFSTYIKCRKYLVDDGRYTRSKDRGSHRTSPVESMLKPRAIPSPLSEPLGAPSSQPGRLASPQL